MIRALLPALALGVILGGVTLGLLPTPLAAKSPAQPVPGGTIGTLVQGLYSCELPGVAGGPVGRAQTEYEFSVINGSTYKAGGERGSYLLIGDRVMMTGGRLKGLKLHRLTTGFLRRIEPDGSDGELRCVLVSRNTA